MYEDEIELISINSALTHIPDELQVWYPSDKLAQYCIRMEQESAERDRIIAEENRKIEEHRRLHSPKSDCCNAEIFKKNFQESVVLVCMKCFKVCKQI